MKTRDLKEYYKSVFYDLRRKGSGNKIILMLLLIPAVLCAYSYINNEYYEHQWYKSMSHSTVVIVAVISGIFWMTMILAINSVSFINSKRINLVKRNFKKDLFSCVIREIPEITNYLYKQKIHPKVFYSSGLFHSKRADYIGDDWLKGTYKNTEFELCELHVFKVFRKVFDGIFVRCVLKNGTINFSGAKAESNIVKFFEAKYKACVKTSVVQSNVFISFSLKGYFFENKNLKMIEKIDRDLEMLKDITNVIKAVIDNIQHP